MFNLPVKMVDVMKKTKDTLTNQLLTAEKTDLVARIATMGVTHIAVDIVMDDNSVIISNSTTPSPLTVEAETQSWCDIIHAAGLNVCHRGTFCGVENIYNFAFDTGTSIGTPSSAPTDGNTTWCGRYYRWLTLHIGSHVKSGDIFAPIPEGTTHAFDGHWFVSSQANYSTLYKNFHTITTTWAATQGVTVSFESHNNYSEVESGYINSDIFSDQGVAGADYYGQYQGTKFNKPSDYVTDWINVYNNKGVPTRQTEFGDLNGNATPSFSNIEARLFYLIKFYQAYTTSLVDVGKMTAFNWWGGWDAQNTSLLYKDGNGKYQLNAWGQLLANFYKSHTGSIRVPVTSGNGTDDHGSQHF